MKNTLGLVLIAIVLLAGSFFAGMRFGARDHYQIIAASGNAYKFDRETGRAWVFNGEGWKPIKDLPLTNRFGDSDQPSR